MGIASKTITFTTSNGSPLPASVTTSSSGTYTATFTASSTVFSGWNIQAHFAGDSLYNTAASTAATYNTVKRSTGLTLVISPTAIKPGGIYSVSGTLTDTSSLSALASKTITFTATSPITITSRTTNSLGQYSATGLISPSTTGTYSIQAHYAGESLYNAANSPTQTLTVSTTVAAAATPSTIGPTTQTSTTTMAGTAKAPTTETATTIARPPVLLPLPAHSVLAPQLQPPQQLQPQQLQPQQLQQGQRQLALAPVANAGISKTVLENTLVQLDGRASYSQNMGGRVIAYQWVQLPIGVPVLLSGANTATPTFTAPIVNTVNTDTVLGFSLRVMDNHGVVSTNPAVVYIMIKHNPNIGPTGSSTNSLGLNTNQPQQPLQQHQQRYPLQSIVPNNVVPIPSQPNTHSPQLESLRP